MGGFPENTITIPDFNNAARAMQSLLKRHLIDTRGTATMTGNSNSASANVVLQQALSPLEDGDRFAFRSTVKNAGAFNLSVNSGTSAPVLYHDGAALRENMIIAGGIYEVSYKQSGSAFVLINPSIDLQSTNVEIGTAGTSVKINGTTAPDLTDEDAALVVGPGDGVHYEIGGQKIQAKLNATTAVGMQVQTGGGDVVMGNASGKVNLAGTTVPDLGGSDAALIVGDGTGTHIEVGGNDIQAKSDGTTTSILDVQPLGGNILIGEASNSAQVTIIQSVRIPNLSSNSAAFNVGAVNDPHVEIGGNDIQAKDGSSATALDLNPLGGDINVGIAGGLVSTKIQSTSVPDVSDADSALVVGQTGSNHLEFGGNDIQAKANATSLVTTLDLNPLGGAVRLPSYTVATLPGTATGAVAFCTDLSGGASVIVHDGSNWVTLGAASGRTVAD